MSGSLEPDEAFQARIVAGRGLAESGDMEGAEAHFRELLQSSRDGPQANLARAISSLITLYGRAGRYLEAYLLSRRLSQIAGDAGPEARETLAFAYGGICGALSQLFLSDPLGRALSEMKMVIASFPEEQRLPLEIEYEEAAVGHALAVKDTEAAAHHLTRLRELLDQRGGPEALDLWVMGMLDANVALLDGRLDDAAALLREVRSRELTPPFHQLQELPLVLSVHTARNETAEAEAVADKAIAILEAVEKEPFTASDRIHQGGLLITELEKMNDIPRAHRVYDLVAAAVMIRLKQVDETARSLPELGLDDPESSAELSEFRKQFLRGQRTMLNRVAKLLSESDGDPVRALLSSQTVEGMIAICAWCESVRPSDGRWLPIGHFVPRESGLKLTHSICPNCAAHWSV